MFQCSRPFTLDPPKVRVDSFVCNVLVLLLIIEQVDYFCNSCLTSFVDDRILAV